MNTHLRAVLALLIFAAVLAGGCSSVQESKPVKGGSYTMLDPVDQRNEVLQQGENSQSPSRISREVTALDPESGKALTVTRTDVELGTSRDPIITIPPAADWTKYIVTGIGALALLGGIALMSYGWPKMGSRLALCGAGMMVIGLTVGSFGWAYALALLAVCGYVLWEQYGAWKKGKEETAAEPEPATA